MLAVAASARVGCVGVLMSPTPAVPPCRSRQVTSLLPSSEVGSELTGHAEASDATWSTDEAIQGENGHLQGPESPSDLEKHHMDAQPGGATQRVNEGCDKRGVECENSGEMRATLHSRRHFAPPVDSPLRN